MTNNKFSKKFNELADTAEQLFCKHGFKRVTVEEICHRAQVSKVTFYKYFSNKFEILKYIYGNWIQEAITEIDRIKKMQAPISQKVELIFATKEKYVGKMTDELMEDLVTMRKNLKSADDVIFGWFLDFLVESQNKDEIRNDVKPQLILAVLEKTQELFDDKSLVKLYPNMLELHREIKNLLWYGIIKREPKR